MFVFVSSSFAQKAAPTKTLNQADTNQRAVVERDAERAREHGRDHQRAEITVGKSLLDAQKALRLRNIDFHEGGFAFGRRDPDRSNLFFKLDDNHTWGCAFFSRSSQKITGISLVFFPSKTSHRKVNESWLRVQRVSLHDDKSYTAHFLPPTTPAEDRNRRQSQPTTGFSPKGNER